MTTKLIARSAALAATVLPNLLVARGRRTGDRSAAGAGTLAAQIDGRLDGMVRDLSAALERARQHGPRAPVPPAVVPAAPVALRPAALDALTGLHDRGSFHETLQREVARAQRYGRGLALLLLDVDDFKAVNDRIGHPAGDGVLAEAADRVRDVVRSADVACRIGGDEFAVILPESTLGDADRLCRRLEAAVSSRPLGGAGLLHLSAGVTELRPDDDAISFFERADDALYRAQRARKGTVVSVESPSSPREAPGTAATT